MILPHKESIDIGHGFVIDIEIEDIGPEPIPNIVAEWDVNLDLPKVRGIVFYPKELLKSISKEQNLPWRVPRTGGAVDALHVEWGHEITAPDHRSGTYKNGAVTFKSYDVAKTASQIRLSFVDSANLIKNFLDNRAIRIAQRESMIKAARANVKKPQDVGGATDERFAQIELQ